MWFWGEKSKTLPAKTNNCMTATGVKTHSSTVGGHNQPSHKQAAAQMVGTCRGHVGMCLPGTTRQNVHAHGNTQHP